MAAQTCVQAQHATLSGSTADSVTFSGRGRTLCVTNRDGTNTLYFRIDGTTAVAAADETFVVLPNQSKTISTFALKGAAVRLSVVANGGSYSAELW